MSRDRAARHPRLMNSLELRPTPCAICGRFNHADELYPATFTDAHFSDEIFSARRRPDKIHYRMVRCRECGLVRSDPALDASALAALYSGSHFDYAGEVENLRTSYGRALSILEQYGLRKDARLLEIGCGNGFFLEEALDRGYPSIAGVEPSHDAIAAASPRVAPQLVCDMMRPGLFEPESFDAVFLFQVFDHVSEPRALLDEIARVLRPGGFLFAVNHNVRAMSARILGESSPIIDIEHTYLYDFHTMRRIVAAAGFAVKRTASFRNTYSLAYLLHLLSIPRALKSFLTERPAAKRLRLTLPLGNLYLVAQKPS